MSQICWAIGVSAAIGACSIGEAGRDGRPARLARVNADVLEMFSIGEAR